MNDIKNLWQISQSESGKRYWNKQIMLYLTIEASADIYVSPLKFEISSNAFKTAVSRLNIGMEFNSEINSELKNNGLIKISKTNNSLRIEYKNSFVKFCLSKAGEILEMMVYAIMHKLTEKSGERIYNDVLTGVIIDWGYEPEEADKKSLLSMNEIDVLAMHNLIPVFISCKNGKFNANEFYKLKTVAEKFGGKYARKAIVVTSMTNDDQTEILKKRAEDLGIIIIEPGNKTFEEFKKCLSNLWH